MLVLSLLLSLLVLTEAGNIPYLKVSGTHFSYAYQVGRHFKDKIQNLINNLDFGDKILPWIESHEDIFNKIISINKEAYPDYFLEFSGLASGANVKLLDILILNFYDELQNWVSPNSKIKNPKIKACSDIMIAQNGMTVAMGHNEDESPNMAGFLIDVELHDDSGMVIEQFISYTYPGNLPGNAFTFNRKYSLFLSMNSLFPVNSTFGLNQALITRYDLIKFYYYFLAHTVRSFISARSMEEVKKLVSIQKEKYKRVGGFNFNCGNAKEIITAEFAPFTVDVIGVPANYSHFNIYKRLSIPQDIGNSSLHRQIRSNQLLQRDPSDILSILGDTVDASYPVYRNAKPPDTSATLASILVDFSANLVSIFDSNPSLSKPFMIFPIHS